MLFEGLNHVHLKVNDIERSKTFYTKGFGMKVASSQFGGKMIALTTPGAGDNLVLSEGVHAGMLDFTGDSPAGESAATVR